MAAKCKIYATGKIPYLMAVANKVTKAETLLRPGAFLKKMIENIKGRQTMVFIAIPEDEEPVDENSITTPAKISGCIVLTFIPLETGLVTWIDFAWSDPASPEVAGQLLETANEVSQELGIKEIKGSMRKNSRAVAKKYGFEIDYTVVKKMVIKKDYGGEEEQNDG